MRAFSAANLTAPCRENILGNQFILIPAQSQVGMLFR
jgi:hypothetical protein